MAKWFAAHVVMYVKLKDQEQNRFTAWENIILIKASSDEEAFKKAECRGREDAGDDDGTFRWGGKPATWVFAGIRKLTSCDDPDRRPGDGSEITYTEILIDSEQSVFQYVNGEPVKVEISDRFADQVSPLVG